MICIECSAPTETLYTEYSNKYVQLTECKNCHSEVDPYVEIDNVLLFIDLLLLKPGAYRHLVYNSMVVSLESFKEHYKDQRRRLPYHKSTPRLKVSIKNIFNWFKKYDTIIRLWVLLVVFEVYLTWVEEEEIYHTRERVPFNSVTLQLLMIYVNKWNAFQQYMFFLAYCVLDNVLFHMFTLRLVKSWMPWGKTTNYSSQIVSYTILLSQGVKIFPILMLIWPYDNIISMSINKWIANLYLIESMKIVTNSSYGSIMQLLVIVFLLRFTILNILVLALLSMITGDNLINNVLVVLSQTYFGLRTFVSELL
ncbi:ARV1 [Nakaseomyces glabratus]|nr:Arv1-like family [Nakaseomyces glabratus]QNG14059.1 ARV1 [Nakaseomyces glabratus]UCS20692.1 ARV1 [Nakaseomyces glabratus]UCS25923.1 ARV1 [Nakaseomyces glabratus]UCS31153.1 ARV1 [Nakaseomyces glabratus]